MENDSVRTSGEDTLVDVWIDGKMRSISLSRRAIAAFLQLPPDRAAALTDEDRREFVRTRLSLVVNAAKDRLRGTDPGADTVALDEASAGEPASSRSGGDRRQGDRRKGERRKLNLGPPRSGERRKGDPRRS
jgi:hypothetical protein